MAIMEAIKSTYLEADAASVDWTSIPATYEHLLLRATCLEDYSNADRSSFGFRFNGDSGNNYSGVHSITGLGSSASGNKSMADGTSKTQIYVDYTIPGGKFGPVVYGSSDIIIADYANANKNTTVNFFGGWGGNGSTQPRSAVAFGFGMWDDTTAVNQITIVDNPWSVREFLRGSEFTLYGIKSS